MDPNIRQARKIFKRMYPSTRSNDHGSHQMSLGSLIKALQKERTGLPVRLSSSGNSPGMPHAYAGVSFDLAFEPEQTNEISVADFLTVCHDSMNTLITGVDSVDYIVTHSTPLWIAEMGEVSGTAIIDIVPTDGYIQLVTKHIDAE